MNLHNFEDKHLFFIADKDTFYYLLMDSFINKLNLPKQNMIGIVFATTDKIQNNNKKINDLEYINYNETLIPDLVKAKSLTFMSLNNANAPIMRSVIDENIRVLDKLYIYLTDDEVDRWDKIYTQNGKIIENKRKNISKDVLYLMSKIKNFIVPKIYFYDKLLKLLQRDTLEVIDASVIFDILPYSESEKLHNIIKSSDLTSNTLKKIMIGTKQNTFNIKETIKIISSFCNKNMHLEYAFIYMPKPRERILIDLYLLYLKTIKNKKVEISYFSQMNSLMYNTLIASSSYIILQPRGGGSTARVFIKWGCGNLCIESETPNAKLFEDIYNVNVINFSDTVDISTNIKESNIDIVDNKKRIIDEELRSIETLKKIYN